MQKKKVTIIDILYALIANANIKIFAHSFLAKTLLDAIKRSNKKIKIPVIEHNS